MNEPRCFVNGNGKKKWQPLMEDGEALYNGMSSAFWSYSGKAGYGLLSPRLYRSKAHAIRIANRRAKRIANSSYTLCPDTEKG